MGVRFILLYLNAFMRVPQSPDAGFKINEKGPQRSPFITIPEG
jgi:hypothetical protein